MREAAWVTAISDPVWDDQLRTLAGAHREPAVSQFLGRLPAGYRQLTTIAEALEDMDLVADVEAEMSAPAAVGSGGDKPKAVPA